MHLRLLALWLATRTLLLLCVLKVVTVPGPDVTSDVEIIYRGWYEILRTGTFPLDDVTWQYPPAAALAVLSPGLLPFLDYPTAFFTLCCGCDAAVLALLRHAGARPGRRTAGAWAWTVGVPLLGPTAYARYDLMVTAVAVLALLVGVRHARVLAVLAAFGALLKVWPALLLLGVPRGPGTRRAWTAAALTALGLLLAFTAAMPGALAFLDFQRDRGIEVESVGALVLHVARAFGWPGRPQLNYGSVEFIGPYVPLVSGAAQVLTVLGFGWLLLWRLRARSWAPSTPGDAAFAAVLLFTTTSRVISPQYLLWLVGLAAVCLSYRAGRMRTPALLTLAATGVTFLEFPVWFAHVVAGDALGLTLLVVRNGLLVAATVTACRTLWRQTVTEPVRTGTRRVPQQPVRTGRLTDSRDDGTVQPSSRRR
ncbi:glycosyltransferase family 87 protein [Streptomyces sp. LHD-70]|uniref:glycosyltransferase family 87 protein n=1 Tax=Streptomyces sp. LHD-70 TaxID=3072140 RepID=UPI00280D8CE7|nr:glycosyltransferase family 87 protein [Streptomyces sp. LHD-70]MDQ8701455.1 glycosyltransferase family 87 protein [Streptomyces sp. LHD-70]